MYIVHSYPIAVALCAITMLCWGSWANAQKLAGNTWPFQLFYWDYMIAMTLVCILAAWLLSSVGHGGESLVVNFKQAHWGTVCEAFFAGFGFNFSNILLLCVIEMAGMAVGFPVTVGVAILVGVTLSYIVNPVGNSLLIFLGMFCIISAVLFNARAYGYLSKNSKNNASIKKAIIIASIAGIVMGAYFPFLAQTISGNLVHISQGALTPYTAIAVFAVGSMVSNLLYNSYLMVRPLSGPRVYFKDYITHGSFKKHALGMLAGAITGIGIVSLIIATPKAGFAISYGMGQSATLIAALWGVLVWREFKNTPKRCALVIALMFAFFIIGLISIILAH